MCLGESLLGLSRMSDEMGLCWGEKTSHHAKLKIPAT
jgi:hypothetical protein